jgi:hypothetical protein
LRGALRLLVAASALLQSPAFAAAPVVPPPRIAGDPWIIDSLVVIHDPIEVGDVIIVDGGALHVVGVPEPGLQVAGNLWAIGRGELVIEGSVVQFLSTYHGQYALAAAEQARARISGCDYRVPNGVQHALLAAGAAELIVEDTDFGDVQILAAGSSRATVQRLTGNFEVIVQDAAVMTLADVPRLGGEGSIWVWVEFGPGSEATYSPPMPGWVESWSFPPPGSSGIPQTIEVERCEARLWPMLVREGSRLELSDIDEANWVVVGLHLPADAAVSELHDGAWYDDLTLPLRDRQLRLVNAAVDTWNLYPQGDARVVISDCTVGEILGMGDAEVSVRRTTIDGSGGFFGARDRSRITVESSLVTCTVEASQDATIELHSSEVRPYPIDPTGAWTRFGAYDRGRLLADQTPVFTTPALGGEGLIAVSYLFDPPPHPPAPGVAVELHGIAAQFSLSDELVPGSWRLEADPVGGGPEILGSGEGNIEEGLLGVWRDAVPWQSYKLRVVLTDRSGRVLAGRQLVPDVRPPPPEASAPRR